METVVSEISLCLIENIIIYVFFNSLLKSRFSSVLPLIIAIATATAVNFLCSNLITVLKIAIYLVFFSICEVVLYKDRFVVKAIYALMALYLLSITDIIFGNILSLILAKDITNIFFTDLVHRCIFSLIIKVVDALVFLVFYKMLKRIDKNMRNKFWTLFSIVTFVFLTIATVFIYIFTQVQNKMLQVQLYILHCRFCFL